MKTEKTTRKMKHAVNSSPTVWFLSRMIAAVVFILPAVAYPQAAEWTVYNTTNSGLPYNGVTSLATDSQGKIWIGTGIFGGYTGGGLAMFDGENWTVYNTSNSELPHNDLPVLTMDSKGNLWIGTDGGGFAEFDGSHWTVYNASNSGMPDNRVYGLPFDTTGDLWISTFGLARFDGISWTVYNTSNSGLPSNLTTCALVDPENSVWIGTWDAGIAKFDGANWTVCNTANSGLPNNTIWDLTMDSQGNLWAGTNGGGLAKFDGFSWRVFNTSNSRLPTNIVHRFAIDSQGHLWMGTNNGLAVFDGDTWRIYNTFNSGLPDNDVWCIAFDALGSIWIGTGKGGLASFCPKPVVDFDGDGLVDIKDLLRVVESWERNDPAIDMAPLPFGDGIVDALDLELLMTYWKQPIDDPSLVANWRFDETEGAFALDSARDNIGYVMGDPIWQPEAGKVAGAIQLDGVDDAVIAGSPLNPADGPFSVFAWVRGGGPGQVIISEPGGPDWLSLHPTAGCLMSELTNSGRGATILLSETTIGDGSWHRIGFIWDGLFRTLYVDGIAVAEDTRDGLVSPANGFYIGTGKAMAPGTYFCGLIDDVRIYNRAAHP